MNITNVESLSSLIGNLIQNSNPTRTLNSSDFIDLAGISKFKSEIFEAFRNIDDKNLNLHNLTPNQRVLFDVLKTLPTNYQKSIKNSLLTSYYTPTPLIQQINKAVLNYFSATETLENPQQPFRILEPSAGNGRFIQDLLAYDLDKTSIQIDAIEKDHLSHRILEENFATNSNVHTHHTGFENFNPTVGYNLIIGNVPFGNYSIFDKNLEQAYGALYKNRIHNYFFLKSSKLLKAGGIMALITTASMIDKEHQLKEYLIENHNLLGAYRFHNKTFSESKTSVISDLLIFQKTEHIKQEIDFTPNEISFLNSEALEFEFKESMEFFNINSFIANNTENVDGVFKVTTGIAGSTVLTVNPSNESYIDNQLAFPNLKYLNQDILNNTYNLNKLKTLFSEDPEIKMEVEMRNAAALTNKYIFDTILNNDKERYISTGNLIYDKNTFYRIEQHPSIPIFLTLVDANINIKDFDKTHRIIEIRNAYNQLKNASNETQQNQELVVKFQQELNNAYDLFDFQYGALNATVNSKLILKDFQYDLLFGLERKNQKGHFIKSDVFSLDYYKKKTFTTEKLSIQDAILQSLNVKGKIDLAFITQNQQTETPDQWLLPAIQQGLLFINPIFDDNKRLEGYEVADKTTFASGYIDGKYNLYIAKKFPQMGDFYKNILTHQNIDTALLELQRVKPYQLTLREIDPSLGETWIPTSVFQDFARSHFEAPNLTIEFIPSIDKYKLKNTHSSTAYHTYSISKNRGMIYPSDILTYALEQNVPLITKTIRIGDSDVKVADKKVMEAAKLNVSKINTAFKKWLFLEKDLIVQLSNRYHFLYNADVKREFDGTHLTFKGLEAYEPYVHQKNAAWQHTIQNGGILDHEVGFGKTLTMGMSIIKRKELGISNKQMVVCLNANFKDVYLDFKQTFPKNNFLLIEPNDVKPDKLQETFYRVANNDWDAIVLAHSSLMKFPQAPEAVAQINKDIITEIESIKLNDKYYSQLSLREQRELEIKLENAQFKFEQSQFLINEKKRDGNLSFEDLKIDHIILDESQYFKNLSYNTRHTRVAGLGNRSTVQKTENLLAYIRSIQNKLNGDKGITFASGTIISNSLSELYTIFKYLRPGKLASMNINSFDQWARSFARKTTEYEESISGTIKAKDRFRYFVKVPELAKLYNDITHYADGTTFNIERPKPNIKLIPIEPYKEQQEYFDKIKKFAETKNPEGLIGVADTENIRKAVGLICTNQGKKATLDMRLIDPNFEDHPLSKINVMIDNALNYYQKFEKEKGTQLIFCDLGTPSKTVVKDFNVYQGIKDNLIKKGIPNEQIAFIHDANSPSQRSKLFDKTNAGIIRFLIGSTEKMGVGVNVQKKLCAMHHLDLPWRPTDMTQRNGRGIRKGNEIIRNFKGINNKLDILVYAKKNSTDAYIFNILVTKERFILQLKTASSSVRTLDEGAIGDNGAMDTQQYLAAVSNNPALTNKLKLERTLQGWEDQYNAFKMMRYQHKTQFDFLKSQATGAEKNLKELSNDFAVAKSLDLLFNVNKAAAKNNVFIKTDNDTYKNAEIYGKHLKHKLNKLFSENKNNTSFELDKMNAFKLMVFKKDYNIPSFKDNYKVYVQTPSGKKIGYKNNVLVKDDKTSGMYFYNAVGRISNVTDNLKIQLENYTSKMEKINVNLNEKFDAHDTIIQLKNKISQLDLEIENESTKKLENNGNNNNDDDNDNDEFDDNQTKKKPKGPKL